MDEEERIKEEKEARELLNQNPLNGNVPAINNLPGMTGAQKGDWYFYYQTTIAFGLNDFIKKDAEWPSKFHVWRMDWDENYIRLYLDNELLNETDLKTISYDF